MQARIVRAPTRVATPLRTCGDPQLSRAVTSHERGYSSACRPTSGSAEMGAVSGVGASGRNDRFRRVDLTGRPNRECRLSTRWSHSRFVWIIDRPQRSLGRTAAWASPGGLIYSSLPCLGAEAKMRAATAGATAILILVAEVWACAAGAEDAIKPGKWEF